MKKLIKVVSGWIVFFGFVFLIGSAGASDLEVINAIEFMIRGVVGMLMILIGLIGLKIGGYRFA